MQPDIHIRKGGEDYTTVRISTDSDRYHSSTSFPWRQGNGVFPYPAGGNVGGHYCESADATGPCAADLPATKTQKLERSIIGPDFQTTLLGGFEVQSA